MMESGISYKGLMFVYDSDNNQIQVFQGESFKVSNSNFFAGDYVVRFQIWMNQLYAATYNGNILRLNRMSGSLSTEDVWDTLTSTPSSQKIHDFCIFDDEIWAICSDGIYYWDGSSATITQDFSLGTTTAYCCLAFGDQIYFWADDGTFMKLYSYDGTTLTQCWADGTYGLSMDYSFYNPYGKPLIMEYEGLIYFLFDYNAAGDLYMMYYDTMSRQTVVESDFNDASITGIATSLLIDDDVLYVSAYDSTSATSNIYVNPLKEIRAERTLPAGNNTMQQDLVAVRSDPILPSAHDKERLEYYNSFSCLGVVGGPVSTVFKYSPRLEVYTDLTQVSGLPTMSLKETLDQICNLLNAYVYMRPDNIAEIDLKDMVGRKNTYATLSDDQAYGDIQIQELLDYEQGRNNFKRVVISWANPLIGNGSEFMGAPSTLNVDEFAFDSPLVNHPVIASNLAMHLFTQMFNSDQVVVETSFAPFLRMNQNVTIKPVSQFMYISDDAEFKIVAAEHNWQAKRTKLTLLERNLIFATLEI
jgi:hypothetical protein